MIENEGLKSNEKEWLERLVSGDFKYKEEIASRLNCAKVTRDYTNNYLNLRFHVPEEEKGLAFGVTIELRAFPKEKEPICFLLHINMKNSWELEVFNVDLSEIDSDVSLEGVKTEIIYDPALRKSKHDRKCE